MKEHGLPDSYLGMEVNIMRPGEDVPRLGTVKKRIVGALVKWKL